MKKKRIHSEGACDSKAPRGDLNQLLSGDVVLLAGLLHVKSTKVTASEASHSLFLF